MSTEQDHIKMAVMETHIIYIKDKLDTELPMIRNSIDTIYKKCPRGESNKATITTHSKIIFFICTFILAIVGWMITRG